jgi:hypothetical protein
MPTYRDLTRESSQSAIIAYDTLAKLTDGSFAIPPEYYEFERGANFTIGGHFGCEATITTQFVTTGSAQIPPPGINWTWQINAIVTVDNGHGNTNTQTLVLLSGTELNPNDPAYVPFTVEGIAVGGTFSFSCDSEILYDITESQPFADYLHPPYTVLNQYERSLVGGTATCSVTLNGQTVTATGTIASSQSTNYNFDATVEAFSQGASGGPEQAILSALTLNSIAIPNYNYLFSRDATQLVEAATTIKALTTGADDAFGAAIFTSAEITASLTLERNIKNKGWINSYNVTYDDPLAVTISNFDGGSRVITANGSFDESEQFKKYNFNSILTLTGSPLTDTVTFDDIPAGNIKNAIGASSLQANGDYIYSTRLPFRGWSFSGVSLYHDKEITLAGTGNTYTFNSPNRTNFSSYRLLRVNAASNSAGSEAANLWISYGNAGSYVSQVPLSISPGANNYDVDLCYAYDLHTSPTDDISIQDNPYPRANPDSSYDWASQRLENDSLYGIGQVGSIFLTGNVTLNNLTLYRNDNTAKCDFVAPYSTAGLGYTTVYTATSTASVGGRRYVHFDVQGRNDEEPDILRYVGAGTSYIPISIAKFTDNINNLTGYQGGRVHLGWTASSSTPNDLSSNLRDGYLNEDGYMSWIAGFGMEYIAGNQKYGFDRDLSEEANDYDIMAQTIFDEINADFIPDYPDPFALETPGETDLLLYSFTSLRGVAHGLVQLQQLGQTVFIQDPSLANRGSSSTDVNGRYQTGLPGAQAEITNEVFCGSAFANTVTVTGKRNRIAFFFPAAPTTSTIKSADISKWYQHLIATVNSEVVNLILTDTYDFSVFNYLATNINAANNVACAWKLTTDTNQILLAVEGTDGTTRKYICDDLVGGTSTLATVIGVGTTPALAINKTGLEAYFIRTTDSSGSIKRLILDNAGNTVTALSLVVSGNVTNDGIACYWYDDTLYLVYNHSSNGITIVTSDDMGLTFS